MDAIIAPPNPTHHPHTSKQTLLALAACGGLADASTMLGTMFLEGWKEKKWRVQEEACPLHEIFPQSLKFWPQQISAGIFSSSVLLQRPSQTSVNLGCTFPSEYGHKTNVQIIPNSFFFRPKDPGRNPKDGSSGPWMQLGEHPECDWSLIEPSSVMPMRTSTLWAIYYICFFWYYSL